MRRPHAAGRALEALTPLIEKLSALEATALALGRFFLDHRARIKDIEINPLMVRPAGEGAVAVDVRVLWREDAQGA